MKLRLESPALEPHDEAERITHTRPVLTLALERDRDVALAALFKGFGSARVARLRASLRSGAGFQIEGELVASHPSVAREALVAALSALPPHDVVVVEGALAIDLVRASLAMAIVTHESPALLPRDLRAVRRRIDLLLFEARPKVLSAIAARLAEDAAGGPV